MEKIFHINNRWEFGIYWRKDWKFIGFIQDLGFGKYAGVTFRRFRK